MDMARAILCKTMLLPHLVRPDQGNAFWITANHPAYHAEHIPPPVYQPPEGGSKVNPTEDWAVPPAGPPPGHAEAGGPSTAMQGVPLGPEPTGQAQVASESAMQGKKPGRLSRLNLFQRG